jgi:hypothetical protein
MFQYAAEVWSREFGLSFSSSENFVLCCEEISLTCRQLHLRGKYLCTVSSAAWKAYTAAWNPDTNSTFALCLRKKTGNLDQVGQMQEISDRSRYSYPAVQSSLAPKIHLYDTGNQVPTLQRTHWISIMETIQLMLSGWDMDICTAAYEAHKSVLWAECRVIVS